MIDDPIAYRPEAIERVGDSGIRIRWSDGETSDWNARQLRDACPCATCREKHSKSASDAEKSAANPKSLMLPVLSAAEARPMRIEGMQPVGTYAYNIAFSDGHNSGLFTFARLRREGL
ncbi:DUF971 domain-containing protein [Neorhodopirellula pilleata]|uniref:Gamma-butyrobetaine hydroxylase-like N-terminal domain-containing protein n=1 Tax=Neorhodopirellula pilleata TaxID=2714738 RepID=A0A5C6AXC6_9BACT|nr:DUF971 domain-containing protein [Neorhodopirellula pilleata]TWU03809.1 hypothetical protein Pla100_07390 [Neorhodopirellula pilleata]